MIALEEKIQISYSQLFAPFTSFSDLTCIGLSSKQKSLIPNKIRQVINKTRKTVETRKRWKQTTVETI